MIDVMTVFLVSEIKEVTSDEGCMLYSLLSRVLTIMLPLCDGAIILMSLPHCMLADRFLEITRGGTDKGTALEMLCNHLKIKLEEVIAFGDGENDLQFLDKAGTAIAMGNAGDSVKAQADIITDTNNNQGVLKALKNLIG